LWYKVLAAKYGEEGGRIRLGGSNASGWWKSLCGVRDGIGIQNAGWFETRMGCQLGNGDNSPSWNDPWLDGGTLCHRFSWIFLSSCRY